MNKITIIGAGNMGGALAKGFCKGIPDADITIAVRDMGKAKQITDQYPAIKVCSDDRQSVVGADIVILSVKPWQAGEVIGKIKSELRNNMIFISVAAGIGIGCLSQMMSCPNAPHIFYAIPNLAAEFQSGITFVTPAQNVPADITDKVISLFDVIGQTMICSEKQLESGMLLASCGIAYIMKILRAQTEAGVEMGFKADDALKIAMSTMDGATSLLRGTGKHPCELIDKVATPGGYTIKGLNEMDHSGLSSAIIKVFKTGFNQ